MSNPARVEVSGPLSAFAPGFLAELFRQGYRSETATKQLQLMAHLSRWLAARELDGSDLGAAHVGQFLVERREHYRRFVSAKGIQPLLSHLRGLGVAPRVGRTAPRIPSELLIDRYSVYLLQRRGLSRSTVRNYANVARAFFAERERSQGELALNALEAAAVSAFVSREAKRLSVGSAKCTVTRLRSLLRFLHVEGEISHDLTGAVPRIARWRLASLVRALDGDSVARLLRSCDQRDSVGRRDLAILTLLSRLGLRAGEVTALRLEDIAWRAGEIMIRGKGSRQEELPLPVDVGEALAGWLRDGRRRCEHQLVFTRVRAPHSGLSTAGIAAIVHAECRRAGLPEVGPHRLRHTAATEMLRAGSSLSDVGQVLRHRDADTTAIYAKVDRLALAALIQPWPGELARARSPIIWRTTSRSAERSGSRSSAKSGCSATSSRSLTRPDSTQSRSRPRSAGLSSQGTDATPTWRSGCARCAASPATSTGWTRPHRCRRFTCCRPANTARRPTSTPTGRSLR